ncbi:DUF2336 domain-containing protein [Rhodospirillum sp. A1_3_36]|uniref:DUF2336 domain-containing protein n=1 Tax=Rhodospirillum sp. A1_3_36 TaxID=3391666 RepID=UPI0039A742EB
MNSLLQRLLAVDAAPIGYEEARELANHGDVEVRRALAQRDDMVPEILYYLAEDPDPDVRRAIADNSAAPSHADEILADDDDLGVRLTLAQKIAALAPGLSDNEKDRVRRHTYQALARLARDQIPRVRSILSDALKHVANAPPALIRKLARDVEVAVSAPVLEFSPVLTDADLLAVIRDQPGSGRLSAIAKRVGLNTTVTDAIAATDDLTAITDMLTNHGAQIREETLDAIIDRSQGIPEWQDPLVHRPRLHSDAARRLAVFVADNLLEALLLRKDLEPAAAVAVAEVVRKRLGGNVGEDAMVDFGPSWRDDLRVAYTSCLTKQTEGSLDETELATMMLHEGDTTAIAALGVMAGITPFAVAAAVNAGSPKGVVAVAWKAGLSPDFAVHLQIKLAKIPPDDVLEPTAEGGWPLSETAMEWQVEMFCEAENHRPL